MISAGKAIMNCDERDSALSDMLTQTVANKLKP
jgi:hypothetical protein